MKKNRPQEYEVVPRTWHIVTRPGFFQHQDIMKMSEDDSTEYLCYDLLHYRFLRWLGFNKRPLLIELPSDWLYQHT